MLPMLNLFVYILLYLAFIYSLIVRQLSRKNSYRLQIDKANLYGRV